ncbi:MAG: C-methyltransferase [Parcubacteria group bacterium Gr01-1014_106]|nr:MAG: C-methyltransferase [Parcubacteria group bacterium Gr01-1014_106]
MIQVLDVGTMPPANSFLKKEERSKREASFPLRVSFCPSCTLLQLRDRVDPQYLFRHYAYMTSASKPLVDYFTEYGAELSRRFVTSENDLVVEIGGNDGPLLLALQNTCRVLNIEPARNIAQISHTKGIPTISEFFSEALAKKIVSEHGTATVLTGSNVFAHIDDMQDVFRGAKHLIGRTGVFAMEVHWVGNLIYEGGFDQIYHEHLCYYSLRALQFFARRFGLKVFHAEITRMHGATLRVFLAASRPVQPSVLMLLAQERVLGLEKLSTYRKFAARVRKNQKDLRALLLRLKRQGKTIAGYGAPAKGNTLLNSCHIDSSIIDYIVDTTIFKQGLYTPGGHIPVYPPEYFAQHPPAYTLLLAWNYADAVLKKEEHYRKNGGKFIIPVPEVVIV